MGASSCPAQSASTSNVNTRQKSTTSALNEPSSAATSPPVSTEAAPSTLPSLSLPTPTTIPKSTKIQLFWSEKQSFTTLRCRLQFLDSNSLFSIAPSLTTTPANLTTFMLDNARTNMLEQNKENRQMV